MVELATLGGDAFSLAIPNFEQEDEAKDYRRIMIIINDLNAGEPTVG